jgi:hypothetical protein
VVPTISAKVDWLTFKGLSGFDSLIIRPNSNRTRASRLSLLLGPVELETGKTKEERAGQSRGMQ